MDAQGRLTLRAGDATRVLDPARETHDARIDLAYAVTTHGSQGASERFSISLQGVTGRRGSLASRDNSYVQLSRAKEHAQVYTDDREGWLRRMERAADRLSAHDVLEAGGDRQARAGSALFSRAVPLAETGLGRQLLRDAGLMGEFMGRFVAGTARYPVPHVALPLFDVNGREAGALLSDIREEAGRHRAGAGTRRAGSEGGRFAGFQRSRDGSAVIADSWAAAEKAARENPATGVLIRLEGEGRPWNMTRILGGEVRLALPADALARQKPPAPALPEALRREAEEKERAERALAQAAERTARSRGPGGRDRDQAAVREVARELSAAEQMRRIERELVKEREPGE